MREREHGRSSITALRSIYYMIKVTLALFVGLFRRSVVPVGGAMTPLRVSIVAAVASILLFLVVFELIRAAGSASATRCSGSRPASCCSSSRPGAAG